MQYFDENVIRDYGDQAVQRFLDLWHHECLTYLKKDFEVGMADRLENPELRVLNGTVNTAAPIRTEGRIRLILWLGRCKYSSPDPLIVTHEIGHWILLFKGFKTFVNPKDMRSENVMSLNSLAQHTPLFALQRSIGHEPQPMIDSQTEIDTNFYNEFKERDPHRWISDALYITDHLTSCSDEYRLRLRSCLKKRMPNVNRLVMTATTLLEKSDLITPANNERFCLRLLRELGLNGWSEYDQFSPFREN